MLQEIVFLVQLPYIDTVWSGHPSGFLFSTIGQHHHLGPFVFQELDDVFREFVHTDDGDMGIGKIDVLLLNDFDSSQTVTDGSMGYLRLIAHTLTNLQGTLEELMQTCGEFDATLTGCLIGFLHLSLYGPLASDGRFQTTYHSEEVSRHRIGNIPVTVVEFHTVTGLQ